MLLSMPLLNTHTALAGCTDLFMAASFGVVNYTSVNRLALHLVPAIAFVTGIAWIKLQQQFIARLGQSEDAK